MIVGASLERGEVRTRAGLGITLAPANFAADDFRNVLLLLLLVAVLEQRRAEHRNAEGRERRSAFELRHLLTQHARLVLAQPAAAVLFRPFRHGPAALAPCVAARRVARRS